MVYRTLKSDCVIETIDRLALRIGSRFPDSGLVKVAGELTGAARRCAEEARRLDRPQAVIRVGVYAVWIAGAAAAAFVVGGLNYNAMDWRAANFVQVLESGMNIAVLVGIGVLALGRAEIRWKRARALDYLHELRSIAHVIDMHQLTKDPLRDGAGLPDTAFSPKTTLSAPELRRYLVYCSEMLALLAKLAALLAQSCRDSDVAEAASDVESLTTGLAGKIWQKSLIVPRTALALA